MFLDEPNEIPNQMSVVGILFMRAKFIYALLQHFLYFLPLPQEQGSLRPILSIFMRGVVDTGLLPVKSRFVSIVRLARLFSASSSSSFQRFL
jgi:hypothetical protein